MTLTAEREALRERVHPPAVACAWCGIATPLDPAHTVITEDRVRNAGDLVFGVCAECLNEHGDRHRSTLVELLGLDPEDPALDRITVERFTEMPGARPDRPNGQRWDHLSLADLAKRIEANRDNLDARACPSKEGCRYCGVSHTLPGSTWRSESAGQVCGSCSARHGSHNRWTSDTGRDLGSGFPFRDVVAAVLVGYESPNHLQVPLNFGKQTGIVFAYEAGVRKGSPHPWAHLDIAAIRATAADLRAKRSHRGPSWFRPEKVGAPRW